MGSTPTAGLFNLNVSEANMFIAQFYHESTGWNGKDYSGPKEIIPMCGSDSIYILDGRKNQDNQIMDILNHIKSLQNVKEIIGFAIFGGPSLSELKQKTKIYHLPCLK